MGAPPLPAPTETDTTTPTELTTELSKPGDEQSTYSLPDDGTPVTIKTRGHKANKSQTSLLIEYFEGSKSGGSGDGTSSRRRPSVRVRLTPSKKGKGDHIQLTETKGSRKASLTRRIPLGDAAPSRELEYLEGEDGHSMTSYASATEESNVSRDPIDIEIDRPHRRRRPASPLIPSVESYQPGNPSEISAIPTDSFLDGTGPSSDVKDPMSPTRGGGLARAAGVAGAGALAGAAINEVRNSKTRSGGKERVKVADRTKDRSDRKHRPKSRKSSVSEAPVDEIHSPRRRSSRTHNESTLSGADSSVVSSSLTPSHRSYDSHSMRSGVSKSSINNPKLLETVEDAIRRLILPELSALKREQSKREERRGSLTSTGTSASRDDVSTGRRRSSGRGDPTVHTPRRRNREARHDYGDASPMSVSRDSLNDDYVHDDAGATPSRKGDMLKGALAGAAVAKGISTLADDKSQSERRERRRRRPESARSRSLGRDRYAEEYEEEEHLAPVPLMPLMSDINPSEMTRTSILSADSDRPHSATEEMVHEVPRGMGAFPGHEGDRSVTPVNLQQTLGTNYANISTGDLNALPRGQSAELPPEYDTDEFGRKIPMRGYSGNERALSPDDEPAQSYEDQYYTTQDVPPPLKYVPYQAGARGLSPIPSVSGYTEGGSEVQQPRLSMTSDAFPSPDKAEHVRGSRSLQSLGSVPSNMRSREFDRLSAGAQSPGGSFRNAGFAEESEIDHTNSGQAVRGIAANPNIIHPVSGVESAVASLVDGDQSVLTSGSYDHGGARDSMLSYDDRSMTRSSRDVSPDKRYIDERHGTPGGRSHDQSEEFSEYEIDENGRKVPRSRYRPTASEAAITAGAVGAAAAALKRAQERKQATVQDASEEDLQPAGVTRNKSFKERTMDGWEPRNTPAHSIDRFDDEEAPVMSARAMPDSTNPMPEAGYMDDDQHTNPSIVQERLDGHDLDRGQQLHDEPWSRGATPTPQNMAGVEDNVHTKEGSEGSRGLGITEAVGAAALGAAAGMAAAHSRQASHDDDWPRTSTERKRDTLLTNPYEDASPVVNPTLNENLVGGRGLDRGYNTDFAAASPGYAQKHDEGYMSNGPNQTPERDLAPKGKAVDFAAPMDVATDDPFYAPKGLNGRQLSGMSQGMASPFYDASTGGGIDRIENKDIVALMQHLMVRDAQRSARDTEIVALLMNAALDMRNSFREMKDLIQETGDDMIFANVENTEKIQKAINGPRPLHSGGPRSMQSASLHATTIDDSNAKTKNLWKRALAGLGAKGSNDLGRIEDMLMHLLGEVDVLKTQTAPAGGSNQSVRGPSGSTMQHDPDYQTDRGYEPEGVSTASHPSQSGQLSMPQANTAVPRMGADRRMSENRISTVPEGDEEYQYDHPSPSGERSNQNYLTPAQTTQRGASVPLDTPPYQPGESQAALSAENTPRTDKSKSKHKSSSSSGWIPKFSRWSETTASSVGRAFRGGKKSGKYDDYAPPSRSGSSMASYDEYKHDDDQDQLHSGFSEPNLVQHGQEPVVRSFTGPQLAPMIPEDPKYKAHRNSLNLQHPQPRPGQTERFRNALEYSAQEYDDPMTPRTADWGGSATDVHRLPPNTNRYSNASSAGVREPEYWASSPVQQDAPPRPPKEPMEDPAAQTPPRSARLENRNLNAALGVPSRKPSGPRAMTPKSPEDEAAREERRRKRDTFGTIASNETDTF